MFSRMFVMVLVTLSLSAISGHAAERVKGPITKEGDIAGAAYRIDIPANWNGGLIMYMHGYAIQGRTPELSGRMAGLVADMGFAVAQSRYSSQGWAAREGILDTEALRRYVVGKYGKTYPTIVMGDSMGAAITYATIERYPEAYDGALPMCGGGASALQYMKERVFDSVVLFNHFFPGLPGSAVEYPDGQNTIGNADRKAKELTKANPELTEKFARMINISSPDEVAGTIAFWNEIVREIIERSGGNPFDNRDTIYAGSDDDAKLNREVPRFTSAPKAVEYMRQWVTFTGDIQDPVLAVHTLVDDLIPPNLANMYDMLTVLQGTDGLYVQHYVEHEGHCNFTDDETQAAVADLVAWIKEGKRPEPRSLTQH